MSFNRLGTFSAYRCPACDHLHKDADELNVGDGDSTETWCDACNAELTVKGELVGTVETGRMFYTTRVGHEGEPPGECVSDNFITCPYCGDVNEGAWELRLYDGDTARHMCGNCNKSFMVTAQYTVTYTSEPIKEGGQ